MFLMGNRPMTPMSEESAESSKPESSAPKSAGLNEPPSSDEDEPDEETIQFLKKYGDLIPSARSDTAYVSNTYKAAKKSKADNGLTSIKFSLESRVLRAGIGTHRKLPTFLLKSDADATPSWDCTPKVQEDSDRHSKACYH